VSSINDLRPHFPDPVQCAMGAIELRVNGRVVRIDDPPPQRTLLDELRDRGLTGAKEGCAEGECGACTVLMVRPAAPGGDATASEYRAINSCLMFLPMAAGQEIVTVEGLAQDGRQVAAQTAMAAAGGSQCGYCTPGFVMSLVAEHYRPSRTGPVDPHALGGNLCRCTGYRPIRDAALSLGDAPDDALRARLTRTAPRIDGLRIDAFTRPTSVDACVRALTDHPDAALVAGGTDLGVESNLKRRRWPHIVSLEAIDELRGLTTDERAIDIGAAVPLTDIGRQWTGRPAAFDEWLTLFASPPIRNRATLGGNLATASPIGDGAPLLLALDAEVEIAGPAGRRTVPLADFFTAYRRTALAAGELLVRIRIPLPLPQAIRFYKVSKRRLDDISTVAAAIAIDRDRSGLVTRARLAFGGVAATPLRVRAAEDQILGRPWDDAAAGRVRDIIVRTLSPVSDHRGSKAYRLDVSASLVDRFAWECTA
jgi:xanthine dehydrogenase small subunit